MAEEKEKENIAAEHSNVSPSQIEEIEAGEYYTPGQLAQKVGYGRAWISFQCKIGKIKAVKILGGQWRIPHSEFVRLTTKGGMPPLPREKKKAKVTEVVVSDERRKKVAPEAQAKEEEGKWRFPLDFSKLFGG